MSEAFRNTFRQSADVYVEDRGAPFEVRRGDVRFPEVDALFAPMLAVGQTAVHGTGDGVWDVVDGFPMLDAAKNDKLAVLRESWLAAEADGTVTMDGVAYDCNDRANRDVAGLIASMEATSAETVQFCAADNSFHELTLADLKSLQLLVIGHAQALYARKWELRAAIESASTFSELGAVRISFADV